MKRTRLTPAQSEALRRGVAWDSRTGDALVRRGLMRMEADCGRLFYSLTDAGVWARSYEPATPTETTNMSTIPTPRNDHDSPIAIARAWIGTDRAAARDDIAAMGVGDAAVAHMELIADCLADGDTRWGCITLDAMREALAELAELAG